VGGYLDAQDLIVFVRDNGLGLAPEVIPEIFEMFTQVHAPTSPSEGGLGIGLALSKGLVQLHGGRITAQSAGLGKGSEFKVALPRSLVIETPEPHPRGNNREANSHVGRRVLIADDNRDGAETLGMVLELSGHEGHLAHSGAKAWEIADEVRPDVAVLDIGMSELNGYDVAKQIRGKPWGAHIILIALTGWGQENDKRLAKAAGFDHHCTKPVDPDELQRYFRPVC
jgi:CheY-like chemotaxis protein